MKPISGRFDSIDIAKGFGILCVVWAHILLTGWSHRVIYAFHMPLFFFISGFLFHSDKYPTFKAFFLNRARRLLLPYTLYSVVTWMVWVVFRYYRGDAVASYTMPLLQTLLAQGSGSHLVHNSALWFIPCLLLVEVVYFFLRRIDRAGVVLALCFAAGGGICILQALGLSSCYKELVWNMGAGALALPFYATGHFIHTRLGQLKSLGMVKAVLLSVAALPIFLWLMWRFGECSMGSNSYLCPMPVYLVRAFLGIFLVMMLSVALQLACVHNTLLDSCTEAIRWCGKKSLDIMCLHIPVKGVMILLVEKCLHPATEVSFSASYSCLAFMGTMIVVVCCVMIIERFRNILIMK